MMIRLACVLLASTLTGARASAYILQPSARYVHPWRRSCALAPRTAIYCASSPSSTSGSQRSSEGPSLSLRVLKQNYESTLRVWTPDVLEGAAATLTLMWKIQLASALVAVLVFSCGQLQPAVALDVTTVLGSVAVIAPSIFLQLGSFAIFGLAQWRLLGRTWLFAWLIPTITLTVAFCTPVFLVVLPFVPKYLALTLWNSDFTSWLDPVLAWYKPYVRALLDFLSKFVPPVEQALRTAKLMNVYTPFLEELAFRRGLQRQMLGQDPSELRRRITYVAVAVLFAYGHLSNHAARLRAAASAQEGACVALATCLNQLSFTFLSSLLIYSPVFTNFGFRAAVGAHACWNTTGLLSSWIFFLLEDCGTIQFHPIWSLLTCSTISGCAARLLAGPWLRRRRTRVQEKGVDLLMGNRD